MTGKERLVMPAEKREIFENGAISITRYTSDDCDPFYFLKVGGVAGLYFSHQEWHDHKELMQAFTEEEGL